MFVASDEAVTLEDLCRFPPVIAQDPACNVGVNRGKEAAGHERRGGRAELQPERQAQLRGTYA